MNYHTADLLALPDEWWQAFDLVVEIITIQALPMSLRGRAVAAVASLVAPGGIALVVENMRAEGEPEPDRPPWSFSRTDIASFVDHGLETLSLDENADRRSRWQAVFGRRSGRPGHQVVEPVTPNG